MGIGPRGVEMHGTWMQTTIYFGADMPGGGKVSDEEFGRFLEEVVTEDFPAGLTVFNAYGQMQKDDGSIEKQETRAVLLVHEKSDANNEKVGMVIDAYRARFSSPQVMRGTIPIDVQFFQSGQV